MFLRHFFEAFLVNLFVGDHNESKSSEQILNFYVTRV